MSTTLGDAMSATSVYMRLNVLVWEQQYNFMENLFLNLN